MEIFNWIFGKKRNKLAAPKVEIEKKPSTTSACVPQSLDEIARQACKSKTTISVQMIEISRLTDLLKDSLQKEYPDLESGEVLSHAQSGLTLRCPSCGPLSEQVVSYLYLAGSGMMQGAVFGGPNVAALAQGRCPGCGGSSVVATFDPARIKARSAALAGSAVESAKAPTLKPTFSFPYLTSLTISPDEEMAAWVSGGKPGAFEIVVGSTSSGSEVIRFNHPTHKYPPKVVFVGNDRLLVSSHLTDELKQVNLALFDVANGQPRASLWS